jgi:hypothetical protein
VALVEADTCVAYIKYLLGLLIVMKKEKKMGLTCDGGDATAVSMPIGPLTSKLWYLKESLRKIKTTEVTISVSW